MHPEVKKKCDEKKEKYKARGGVKDGGRTERKNREGGQRRGNLGLKERGRNGRWRTTGCHGVLGNGQANVTNWPAIGTKRL